jgi:uncharacterized protein (DUF1697 family)
MEALRELFAGLGFSGVETFIASGNVIFQSKSTKTAELEKRIERHLAADLGYPVAAFLRNDAELAAICEYRPFEEEAMRTAGALCVGFLAQEMGTAEREALMSLQTGIDTFHVHGRELYRLCRKKQSESTISNAFLERKLKVPFTFRSVTTVAKLANAYLPPRRRDAEKT